jgi:hypothetical protein
MLQQEVQRKKFVTGRITIVMECLMVLKTLLNNAETLM